MLLVYRGSGTLSIQALDFVFWGVLEILHFVDRLGMGKYCAIILGQGDNNNVCQN